MHVDSLHKYHSIVRYMKQEHKLNFDTRNYLNPILTETIEGNKHYFTTQFACKYSGTVTAE